MSATSAATVQRLSSKAKPFSQVPRAKGFLNRILPVSLDFIRHGGPPHMHEHIDERHKQLGPIFREKMGPYELISVTDTEMIRSVIKNEGKYPETKLPPAWSLYMKTYNLKRGLFFQKGCRWLETRRALDKILLDQSKIDKFTRASWSIASDLLQTWEQESRENSDVILLQNFALDLSKWSIENIGFMLFGQRLNCLERGRLDSPSVKLVEQANNMLEISERLQILPVELMQKLNARIWTQFRDSMQELMQIARSISEDAMRNHPKRGLISDIMSTSGLEHKEIVKNMIDFLVAAADTSAATVTWALYLFGKYPQIQAKAREEIQTLVFSGFDQHLPEISNHECSNDHFWDSLNQKLTYIDGFVRETMRLYPPAPFISRQLPSDMNLGDYMIPAGVHVIFPLITTGRMAAYFQNPLELIPERWLFNEKNRIDDGKANKLASLPFGLGPRMCIGRRMANLEIKMLLACILNSYEIRLADEAKPIKIKLRMTTWPDEPLRLKLIPITNKT